MKQFTLSLFLFLALNSFAQQIDLFYENDPHLQVRANMGSVQLAIATCNGCFSSQAQMGDAVLRTNGMATGDLIIAARSNDGIVFTTGDGSFDSQRMEILNNGKVTIGSIINTPGDYRLYVDRGILAERMKVAVKTTSDWADFVFEENYKLRSLQSIKAFINQNGHLPDVPSAEQMVENGLDVLEMNALLLRKVEELTLHMIELNERIKELESKTKDEK
ncbi:MAG: hypothetical protein AAGI23_08555 [Bacteroidota bacterium]